MAERKQLCTVLWAALSCCLAVTAVPCGADWPMWRYDANRSAASPAELPAELHLQWKRELPSPRPAFPEDLRLCFDVSYEPVVMGNTMFLPSMVTDSLAALDTGTGAEKWKFFADAPVRFAPAAWRGRVYFVSDDAHLYCLDSQSGSLLWKFSPLSSGRKAHKLLGNERLISRWPARGGPVLADGIVYAATGIWPFEGVYVYAVDAQTGELVWANKDTGFIENGLIDHGTRRHGGLSPQGYLAIMGGRVLVPSGRALAAFFDAETGEMEPYTTGWGGRVALAKGCWYVAGIGKYFFQSGDMYGLTPDAAPARTPHEAQEPLSFEDFAQQASVPLATVKEWAGSDRLVMVERDGERLIGAEKPSKTTYVSLWTHPLRRGEEHALRAHPRLQIDPANGSELGVFREPVLTRDAMYYSRAVNNARGRGGHWPPKLGYAEIVAYDITNPEWGLTCQGRIDGTKSLIPWKTIRFDQLWSLPAELKVHIKAGSRLYAGAPGVVAAVDIPEHGAEPRVSWKSEIEGRPSRMLAADDRLFVVTEEGCIYCFGGKEAQAKTYPMRGPRIPPAADEWTSRAAEILKQSGVTEGYCLALGIGTGRLVQELARQSELHIVVLDADAKKVDAARRKLDAMGLYGSRVHILAEDLASARLPPYMANLAVAESLKGLGSQQGKALVRELFNCLHPYGGVACLPVPQPEHGAFAGWVKEAKLAGAEVKRAGDLTLLTRAGAVPGSADWTHESGNAGNTFASNDQRVKPPFGVLWFGGSVDRIFPAWDYTHCRGPLPVIANGRIFILIEDALYAADIYTGRLLWTVQLAESAKTKSRRKGHMITQRPWAENFVAAEDSLYVVSNGTCLRLDPATGGELGQIGIPEGLTDDETASWQEVRVWEDYLLGTTGKHLLCMDRRSGKELWRFASRQDRFSFAVRSAKAFCVDYWLPVRARRGETRTERSTIFALDVHSGEVVWQAAVVTPADAADEATRSRFAPLQPRLSYCDANDVLLLTATRSTVGAYKGASGDLLWAKDVPCRNPPSNWSGPEPPILLPDVLITHAGEVYDPRTGTLAPKRLWIGMNTNTNAGGARGCGRALANEHVVTLRDAHAAYFDLTTGQQTLLRGVRSGCTNSLIPAGGVLNAPNFAHGCSCNWPIFASFALAHMPEAEGWGSDASGEAGGA